MNVELTELELKIVLGALSDAQDAMDEQLKILLRGVDNKEDEAYLLAEETKRLYKTVFKHSCNNYAADPFGNLKPAAIPTRLHTYAYNGKSKKDKNNNLCIGKVKAAYRRLQSWYRRSHYCAICGHKFYPFDLCISNTRTGNRMHFACYTNHRHWIDDADSYICPECGFITNNPNKYYKFICPRCGFQDKKDV